VLIQKILKSNSADETGRPVSELFQNKGENEEGGQEMTQSMTNFLSANR